MLSGEAVSEEKRAASSYSGRAAKGFQALELPALVAVWLVGRVDGSGSKVWTALPAWLSVHAGLEFSRGVLFVTAAVTLAAICGALLQWSSHGRLVRRKFAGSGRGGERSAYAPNRFGLLATCAPISILLPVPGALVYVVGSVLIVLVGWRLEPWSAAFRRQTAWQSFLRNSFPLLSAVCFAALAWTYQPDLLTRGLLIAAGMSLILRALASEPPQSGERSSAASGPVA